MKHQEFLFVDLEQLKEAKAFDGVAEGVFKDMLGRRVVVSDLDIYVKNTQEILDTTKTESGELVGLPIDSKQHDKGDAAGWIVGFELMGNIIRFIPKWTELGLELIEKGKQRFFSPTIDLKNKVILGGSLTNWPASRTKKGKILLRPIELSEEIQELAEEESLDAKSNRVRKAFNAIYNPNGMFDVWVVEVFDDYLVCSKEAMWRVDFEDTEDGIEFQPESEWVEVRQSWVEAALKEAKDLFKRVLSGLKPTEADEDPGLENPETEVDKMEVTLEKLSKEQIAELKSGLLVELSENPTAEMTALIEQKADEKAKVQLAKAKRKDHTAQFCTRMIGGTEDDPSGLPVAHEKLEAFLSSLEPEQQTEAEEILSLIHGKGQIDYKEKGHGKDLGGQGTTPLPEDIQESLDNGDIELSDLSGHQLAPVLGDLKDYDLSKWKEA